jgi:hypothetical protein
MRCRWWSFLALATVLCVAGFAQKGQVQDKPDPLAKPDPTVKVQNWRITPIKVAPRNPADYVRYTPRGDFFPASGGTVVYDVTGTPSYDSRGASCNVRVTIQSPNNKTHFSGIGWDVQLTATSPSYLSEIAVLITNVNGEGYILRPGAGDTFGGTGSYSSNGLNDLCGVYGLPPLNLPDGNLYLEFFETYDDFPDCGQDGNWDSGTLTFAFDTPAPFTGYDEVGDAGDLPESAQATPSGALTGIRGTLTAGDVDMYAIYIANPFAFAASTRCNALFDTQLFLFDANGNPVSFNDDAPDGGLTSRLDGSCIPGPGLYYLAVSAYDRDAVDCNGAELWNDGPFGAIRCADGTGSGRVGGWTGSHSVSATYIITLEGAEGASPGDPEDCPPFQGWDEFGNGGGDAGDLPETSRKARARDAIPVIRGQLDASDVDMYAIYHRGSRNLQCNDRRRRDLRHATLAVRCERQGRGVRMTTSGGTLQSRIDNTAGCYDGTRAWCLLPWLSRRYATATRQAASGGGDLA